ncbi:Protein Skeletor, isoforms B/C [Fragariocoptes setiger]|uniref:Protein Skeletor, isoforms B/C n=1 Tax=Fragariocoptes setiger TaxID=1670756 RepID=A0ABQ7S997_9ACAR|nr:Protein Skeletor, isoforms B/C [Fragariocoptes setiger]
MFQANFGHIVVPLNFEPPAPLNLGPLPTLAHKTKADSVMIEDAKTIRLRNLHYDGAAPDAFFLVGTGSQPNAQGIKVPDENGSLNKLHGYNGQDIVLRLPTNLTVMDIDWFALYCITYEENFGHVRIPRQMNIPADTKTLMTSVSSFSNCEVIFPDTVKTNPDGSQKLNEGAFQVSWEIRQPDIYFQLEARISPDRYVSFGTSGDPTATQMIGSDVIVAFYDSKSRSVQIQDYMLTDKSQCNAQVGSGSCPDHVFRGGRQDAELISSSYIDGIMKVIYRRKLDTGDDVADRIIGIRRPIVVVGAVGALNSRREAGYHSIAVTSARQAPIEIHFGRLRASRGACKPLAIKAPTGGVGDNTGVSSNTLSSASLSSESTAPLAIQSAWPQPVISDTNIFEFVIGPSGGDKGYTALTGIQSWGIAYWVNDKLIPILKVRRGQNYTFVVQTGKNPQRQAKYHPVYITNHPEGGGGQRPEELGTSNHQVYAGVRLMDGRSPDPSPGAGRYCELEAIDIDRANESQSVASYRRTLTKVCENGEPARFVWMPDDSTPDTVYYQCFTHRNLGWKIQVSSAANVSLLSIFALLLISSISCVIHRNGCCLQHL